MGSVRKLPSGKFNARVSIDGEKISKTFSTSELAYNWIKEQEKPETESTVESLTTTYLQSVMVKNGVKRGGYESIENRLNILSRNLNQTVLESITKYDVLSYHDERLKAVSGSTVRLEIQLLSRLLRWACDEKGVECNDVTKGVKLPEPGKPRSKVVEPLELEMIIGYAPDAAKDFFALAYETAMRRNELLYVTPKMINISKRIISLSDDMCKNGEARDVPLTKKAVEILKRLCDGKQEDQRIFLYSPYGITQAFRRAARLAKVDDVCLHSLRHSAITRFAEMGLSTFQLRAISGHKSIDMLARYTHVKAKNVLDLIG